MYKALTFIRLHDPKDPSKGNKKSPGEKITEKEMSDSGQSEDDIKRLLKDKAISEDMDAEIHSDHANLGSDDGGIVDKETGSGEDA